MGGSQRNVPPLRKSDTATWSESCGGLGRGLFFFCFYFFLEEGGETRVRAFVMLLLCLLLGQQGAGKV